MLVYFSLKESLFMEIICPTIKRLYMYDAVSLNKSMGQKEAQERAFPTRFPSRSSSVRPSGDGYRNLVGSSSPHHDAETKADAWEKAKTEKIKKR